MGLRRRAVERFAALGLGLLVAAASGARASHLAIDLTVEGRPAPGHAGTDTSPPASGTKPRPLVQIARHDLVKLHWTVRNTDAARKLEKLLVHVFIVREPRAGQKEVPDPRQGSVWESALATALDAGRQTSGAIEIPISEAGFYLVRVESQFTEQDHEHFAAVDLQIE